MSHDPSDQHDNQPHPYAAEFDGDGRPAESRADADELEPVVEEPGNQARRLPFPVVGIGASAGGVEAYIELLSNFAPDSGMALVVIPHLLADHKSHLAEILGRHTKMRVTEIETGMKPEPNTVYVLPPNARVRLEAGILRLEKREADTVPRPIDYFFRSLAVCQQSRAVGVVLSGTDADGALGLKAIKGEGGITIVQSPESAKFSEMPRSSILMDGVDRILPPALIAAELSLLGRQFHQPALRTLEEGIPPKGDEQHLTKILGSLHAVSGIDFRLYKPTTIRRRIARRMLLHRKLNLAEYAAFLQGNTKELKELQDDALINVTRFFRDPAVFDALKETVLPRIVQERSPDQQVRIWVAGCSSGEEAYSIAICLLENLTGHAFEPPIQIFGTDASDHNIHRARAGIFPEAVAAELSPDRLRRFFVKVDKGYQVSKRVRDLCIFARQNLSHDPPFSKMDLISCRNVLIYLGNELQKQILPTFHYALRSNGFLLLGTSETVREFTDLFQLIDRKNKFFIKTGTTPPQSMMRIAPQIFVQDRPAHGESTGLSDTWGDIELQRAADRIVLARYGPPGVVINETLEILQSRGHTAPFLEMPQGAASFQLLRMLREPIATSVSQAVKHAVEQDVPVRLDGLRVKDADQERDVTLEVLPIHTSAPRTKCFLVLFPSTRLLGTVKERENLLLPPADPADLEQTVIRLRQDLSSTKLYLQTLLEERDAKNQELVSANEEIQSTNEEMQSTNEELETTKEELQSSNEELQTVNDELQQRNVVLTQTTNDLSNLLNSVNLPVLMLGSNLHIRHFTPPIQRLMNLRLPDIGRPFGEIRLNLQTAELEPLFLDVLETLMPRELEVQDNEGRWYLLRVRPYRTTDNKIEGLVVVLLDIDQLRRSQQELSGARDFAASIIENVPLPLAVVDVNLKIRAVNDAFRSLSGSTSDDLNRRSLLELAGAAWGLDEPLRFHLDAIRSSSDGREFEFDQLSNGSNPRFFHIRGRVLRSEDEQFFLLTIEDISAQKEVERLMKQESERLAREVASTARELGRTREELRALAASLFTSQEDERARVARELHDDINQKLAAIGIEMLLIQQKIATKPEEAGTDLLNTQKEIESLCDEVRNLSHGLHPASIDDLGLATALRSLVQDFQAREQMIATFTAHELSHSISKGVATTLYRITQEALRNIAKHAGKTHVKVTLKEHGHGLRLQIVDSGDGFDSNARRVGLGLISMEERARMLEGTFTIDSRPGDGTRITIDVPWSPPPRQPRK